MHLHERITGYLLSINGIVFVLFGLDKRKAKRQKRRVKESTLLLRTALGGYLGAIAGMEIFRHKTMKSSFLRKFWLIVIVWLGITFYVLSKM